MKKAQMEMMGLVIIVVLITLGMFFLALFAFPDHPDKKVFARKGLASSTLSAILKMTVPSEAQCHLERAEVQPALGEDVLRDCARVFPSRSTFYQCVSPDGPQNSCDYFRFMASDLLEKTLGKWGKHYELRSQIIRSDGTSNDLLDRIMNPENTGCGQGERDSSGLFPIPFEGGLIENELWVCD